MKKRFGYKQLLQYFLQGVLVLAPISITIYLIVQLFNWLDNLIPIYITLDSKSGKEYNFPGLGFIIVIAGIILIGWISSFFVIERLLNLLNHLLEKTPGIKIIYSFFKDFGEAVAGKKRSFQKAVLVNIFQPDVWQIGFITNEDLQQFGLKDYITVYVPNSYAVTGQLYLLGKDKVKKVEDVSGGDALKYAISGGVVDVEE